MPIKKIAIYNTYSEFYNNIADDFNLIFKHYKKLIAFLVYSVFAAIIISQLKLSLLAANAHMTTLALVFLLYVAGAAIFFAIIKLINSLRNWKTTQSFIKTEFSKDPIDNNPVKSILSLGNSALGWLNNQAILSPWTMIVFGGLFIFPTTILIMHFYYHVAFSGPIAWLLNNVFLPTANGLVSPGQMPWLAAMASGFLYAKLFFLIANLITEKQESLIGGLCKKIIKNPILYLTGLLALLSVTKILAGISFLTHLSGYWIIFSLSTVMLKVVLFIWDLLRKPTKGIMYSTMVFPLRILANLNNVGEILRKAWFEIKTGIFEIITAPFTKVLWPIVRTYIHPFKQLYYYIYKNKVPKYRLNKDCNYDDLRKKLNHSFPEKEAIQDKYPGIYQILDAKTNVALNQKEVTKLRTIECGKYLQLSRGEKTKKAIHKVLAKVSFGAVVTFSLTIYTAIPLVYLIFSQHLPIGPAFNWFNQLLLGLQAKTNVSLLCLTAIIALLFACSLIIYTSGKNSARQNSVLSLGFIVSTMSIITNALSIDMSRIVTYFVISAIGICLLRFAYLNIKWFNKNYQQEYKVIESEDMKPGETDEKRRTKTLEKPSERNREPSAGAEKPAAGAEGTPGQGEGPGSQTCS